MRSDGHVRIVVRGGSILRFDDIIMVELSIEIWQTWKVILECKMPVRMSTSVRGGSEVEIKKTWIKN